jgi:hypothetical protein
MTLSQMLSNPVATLAFVWALGCVIGAIRIALKS